MEFPDLGKRCTHQGCNMFDFLPYTCGHCKNIYCQDHFKLQDHQCPSLNDPNMDVRVPTCPICQKPVPGKRGEDPNIRMNQHIQNNCADLEPKSNNTCRKKGCATKMLVPMQCTECGLSFCVKHRLEVDHQCQGKPPAKLFSSSKKQPQKQQNNRAEMERQRRERVQQRNQEIDILQTKVKQGKITDSEQMRLAKLLSMDPKNDEKKCIVS